MKMRNRVIQLAMLVALSTLLIGGSATAVQIAHYDCDGPSLTAIQDSAGYNNWATMRNGIAKVADPWGGTALSFDGVNDYIDWGNGVLTTGFDTSMATSGAIEFWFYTPQAAPFGNYLDVRLSTAGAGWNNHSIMMNSANYWSPIENARDLNTLSDGTNIAYSWGRDTTDATGAPLNRDVWTHKVYTWSPYSGGTLVWEFVNGVQESYVGSAMTSIPLTGMTWWLGRTYGNGNPYYTGIMDEISFWDSRVTAGTALARYEAGVAAMLPIPEPGSLLALSMGLVGLVGAVTRRRK